MSADRPSNLRLSGTYDLPFGKGQKFASTGVANHVLGGWHLNSIFSAYSGSPFSASGGNLNTPGFTQRANQVKADVNYLGNIGNGQLFFDTSAFVAAPTGVIGNAGYNTLARAGGDRLGGERVPRFQANGTFHRPIPGGGAECHQHAAFFQSERQCDSNDIRSGYWRLRSQPVDRRKVSEVLAQDQVLTAQRISSLDSVAAADAGA